MSAALWPGGWRLITVGLIVPDTAFGAAVDVDDLLLDPELHYTAAPESSRLLLMPRAGAFSRLVLEWENLPEIGVFTSGAVVGDAGGPEQLARLETWMRDVAVACHGTRDRIREAAERVVADASLGLAESLPRDDAASADRASADSTSAHGTSAHRASTHTVSAHLGTTVSGPDPRSPFGVVDAVPGDHPDETRFVARASNDVLGRRITSRDDGTIVTVRFEPLAAGVDARALSAWYDQHIAREVLFDDVWQVYVHLIAGLDAPASIHYPG